jgi:hypothetical protein
MEVEYSDTIVVWISVLNVVLIGMEVSVGGSNVVVSVVENVNLVVVVVGCAVTVTVEVETGIVTLVMVWYIARTVLVVLETDVGPVVSFVL